MSDEDPASVVRALYAAFDVGDHDGIRRCLADDLRWRQAGSAVPAAGEDAEGRESFMDRVILAIERDWDGFSEPVDQLFAADGHVVATGTYRGTHRRSGRRLEAEFCHLWRVREGLIRGFRQYTDTASFAEAIEAEDDAGT